MSTFTIPSSDGQIRQNNRAETFGELLETFGIDLNKKFGKINTSKKLVKVLDETTHFGGSDPIAFAIFNGEYYVLTDDKLYKCSTLDDPTDADNWSEEDEMTGSVATNSDLAVFGGLLLISNGTNAIYSLTTGGVFSSSWSSGKFSSLTAVGQMHVHRGGQETLVVANGNNVKYYNTTGGEYTISLQSNLDAKCINSGVNAVWAGTESTSDGNAYVYEFYIGEVVNVTDDAGAIADTLPLARNAHKVEGKSVMSIEVIDNIPYIVTEKGHFQSFNGAGFSTVASFPFASTTEVISMDAVHPKGMKLHNDSVYINISTERRSGTDHIINNPSGIWEYNRLTQQLHHRFAFVDTDSEYGTLEMSYGESGPIMILDNVYALLLACGSIENSTSGVFADTGSQYGYFKTIEIQSGSVLDAFERAYIKAKTMVSGEKINIKYRLVKKDHVICTAVMTGTKQMNTTTDLSSITANSDGGYNWEVVNIHTGKTSQVTDIKFSGSTYAVYMEDDFNTDGTSVRVEFQNWTKVSEDYDSNDGEMKYWGGFGTNPWIQFKVTLDGAIEIRQFLSKSNVKNEV